MKHYLGINKKQSYSCRTKEDLAKMWRWSHAPFVVYDKDYISLTNKAWPEISKGDARKNPAIKFPKGFEKFDYCVIQYGKKTHPHVPMICLLNPELFSLVKGKFKPQPVNWIFFDYMDFLNGMGIYSEYDLDKIKTMEGIDIDEPRT